MRFYPFRSSLVFVITNIIEQTSIGPIMKDLENLKDGGEIKSLYLHFPFCTHLCNFCDFYKVLTTETSKSLGSFHLYLKESMTESLKLFAKYSLKLRCLKTLFIGGGTPSLWGEEGANFFLHFLRENELSFEDSYEFTMELNPNSGAQKTIDSWMKIGCNRFSLGIQSMDSYYLKMLDRDHSLDDCYHTLKYLHKLGVNFSVDLMLGIPNSQTRNRNVLSEIDELLQFSPSHFSLYILTPRNHYCKKKLLPEDGWIGEEYLRVCQYLKGKGFEQYEVSNFSKHGKVSLHNLQYWKMNSVAALGPSATGLIVENEQQAFRYKWKVGSPRFQEEFLGPKEIKLEKIYMNWRTYLGLNPTQLFLPQEMPSFVKLLDQWDKLGYIESREEVVRLTSRGFLMLDSLMGDLFREIKSI